MLCENAKRDCGNASCLYSSVHARTGVHRAPGWVLETHSLPCSVNPRFLGFSACSACCSTWLYMGIVVDFVICLRLTRYMRIHVGLKAFYQVRMRAHQTQQCHLCTAAPVSQVSAHPAWQARGRQVWQRTNAWQVSWPTILPAHLTTRYA